MNLSTYYTSTGSCGKQFWTLILALLILLSPGCSWLGEEQYPMQSGMPSAPSGPYLLRAGDVVLLEVFQEPYMTTRQKILADGTISVGLIGRVPIAGDSVTGAAQKIATELNRKHLVNPQVNLSVEGYAPRRFVVWGRVRSPGTYTIPGEEELTLPEAIAMAGGNSDIGDLRSVTVTRRTPGGQDRVKLNALSPAADQFYIREGDIIRVSETIF